MATFRFLKGDSARIGFDITPFSEGSFHLTSDDGTLYLDYVNTSTGEEIRLPINAKEEEVSDIVAKHFLIIETTKQGSNYLFDGITFDEIYEKFNTGNVNMVCHVDGTDYIPLLSVTRSSIIFSGIYNTTSVSLVFNTQGVGTLTTTYLTENSDLQRYYTKTETDEQIANLVNSAPETLDTLGELATAFEENKEVVDVLNDAIVTKASFEYVDIAGRKIVKPSSTTFTLEPNKFYTFGTVSTLNITLGAEIEGVTNEFSFEFSTGSSISSSNFVFPSSVKWVVSPTIEANKIYHVSILRNVGVIVGV